jgi:hypothetical protein
VGEWQRECGKPFSPNGLSFSRPYQPKLSRTYPFNGRDTMNPLTAFGLSAMLAVALASFRGSTFAQQKSLKEQFVGAWTLARPQPSRGSYRSPALEITTGLLIR